MPYGYTWLETNLTFGALTSPGSAAFASVVAFAVGAVIPLAATALTPTSAHLVACFISVIFVLIVIGYVSANFGDAPISPATLLGFMVGYSTMKILLAVGRLSGVSFG